MDIFVDRQSTVPPYLQIKNRIQESIESGECREHQGIESVRDIAQIAGVSPATVQKALHELKQQKLIYPKAGAGYFVAKKSRLSNNVFVLLPSSRLTFYTNILDGMFEANRSNELTLQICSLDTDKLAWNEKTAEILQLARSERSSVIFVEEAFGEMKRECLKTARKVPFVTIEWILENAVGIVNDYRVAGFAMIDYCLHKRGAKTIMVLKGRERQYNSYERILGMLDAVKKFGLVKGKDIVFYDTDFDAISAYETVKQHYGEPFAADAVICANDYEGMGAIGAFLEKRILVGKDVALIGFGDMIDSVSSYIPLTTMDQQLRLIGQKAITSVNTLLKGGDDAIPSVITIPTRLVERMT